MRTQKEVRKAFWQYLKEVNPSLYAQGKRSKGQNEQITDIRCCFVDWLDSLYSTGKITERQVNKYTL